MKNKKLLIGLVAGAVLVIGAAAYFLWPEDELTMARNAIEGKGEATCTFTDAGTNNSGTLYVRDGDMRMVAKDNSSEGQGQTGNILIKDDVGYFWTDGQEQGFKFDASQPESTEAQSEGVLLKDLDEEEFKKEYERNKVSCTRGASADMFDVPQNVEFLGAGDITDSLPETPDASQQQDVPSQEEIEEQLRQLQEEYNY